MARDDGSVTIKVKAETKEAEKKLVQLQKEVNAIERQYASAQKASAAADVVAERASNALNENLKKRAVLTEELEKKQNALVMQNAKVQDLFGRSSAANARLDAMSAAAPGTYSKQEIKDQEAAARYLAGELERAQKEQEALNKAVAEGSAQMLKLETEGAALAANQEKTANDATVARDAVQELAIQLEGAREDAGEAASNVEKMRDEFEKLPAAGAKAGGIIDEISRRVKGLVKRVLIFSVITTMLRGIRKWISSVIKASPQTAKALEKLKAALLTLVQPFVNIIIPAVEKFLNIMTTLVVKLASFISQMFGSTLEESAAAAKALQEEQEALEGVGSAAKKSSKDLAGFDEINKIGDDGSGAGGVDYAGALTEGANSILGVISGAVLLALGALLTFTGHPMIGIPMMVAGAITIYQSAMGDSKLAETMVKNGFTAIMKVAGGFLALIGIFLVLFTGNIMLGLGLIVAGITLFYSGQAIEEGGDLGGSMAEMLKSIASTVGSLIAVLGIALMLFSAAHFLLGLGLFVSGIALWEFANVSDDDGATLTEKITNCLSKIAGIVGPFLAILGIIFILFLSRFVEGFGMLVAGIALWTFSEMSDDEGATIGEKIVLALANIAARIGPFLAILGLILMFVPGKLAIGLGLLVFGIALFAVGSAVMDANETGAPLIDALSKILTDVGVFLFVIGLILIFIPGMQGIGFGLMVAGIAAVAAGTIMPNWNFILEKLKSAWATIKSWWNIAVSKFTDPDWWFELGKNMLDGLFNGFKSIWNTITGWVSDGINWIKNKFSGAKKDAEGEFSGSYSASVSSDGGSSRSVSISDAPRLAQGAVIPPNREFMAVLGDQKSGTNIESPVSEIENAVARGIAAAGGAFGSRDITIILQLERQEFARAVYKANNEETQRVGVRLVGSGI